MKSSSALTLTRRGLLAATGLGVLSTMVPSRLMAQSGAALVIAAGQDIPNFDPHTATGYSASFFMRNVYDPLVRTGGVPPQAVPALAESWTVSPEGTEYVFKLNGAAKFHSGSPVTADDVVYSFQRALQLAKGNSWMIRDIVTQDNVSATDASTVTFKLGTPFAPFLQVIPWIFVVEKAVVEANLGTDSGETYLMSNTAGSGPFNIARSEAGTLYQLARNPQAWQADGGNLDAVIWQIVRETATQRMMIQRGEAHIAIDLTSEDMDTLENAPGVVRIIEPEYRTFSFKLNTAHGPCADVNLRKAISYATNYQAVLDAAGYADQMTGPLPPDIFGYDGSLDGYKTDLDKAREYMAKSSQPEGGFKLKIYHVSGLEQQRRWALILLDSLKQLNIELEIVPMNWPDMVAACRSPETFPDIFCVYQTANYGDPDNIAFAAYHSSRNGGWQNAVYKNPDVDALIEAGRKEIDDAKRIEIYRDFQKKVLDDAPDIFGVVERRKLAMRDTVKNYHFSPVASNAIEAWGLSVE